MDFINLRSIFTIAKKEFLDNIRNKWIIVLTALLFILVLVFSYLAGSQTGSENVLGDMETTVFGLLGISSFIIPLIAIILGFGTISGEAESGALSVVLSYPVSRLEVLLGKLLGLGSVIVIAVLVGFGFGGIIITATVSGDSWAGYLAFMGLTIFLGFIFLSLSICVSAFFKRRITSIGGGIIIFLWGMIIGFVFFGILLGTGFDPQGFQTGNIPDWFWIEPLVSPPDLHQTAVMRAFGLDYIDISNFALSLPEFLSIGLLTVGHIIWLVIPLILAYWFFIRRDI